MKKISIIICSQKVVLEKTFENNILETVGCDHELIVINNSDNQYSIFEAYNIGILKSTSPYLVFIHEDLIFQTSNWGNHVIQLFEEHPKFGLFGVAGSRVKTKTPSGWWDCENNHKLVNIIQHHINGSVETQQIGFKDNHVEEAVVIDGVFLAYRKLKNVKFNECLTGFHGYDLNICFEVLLKGYKIGVTDLVSIEHFSIGTINLQWLKSVIQIHDLYKKSLPVSVITNQEIHDEIFSLERLLNKLIYYKKKRLFIKFWFKLFLLNPFSKKHRELINTVIKKIIK
jgi:hypothetical protein